MTVMARLDCHNRHPLHEVRETRRAPPAIEHTPCALGIAPFNITLQSHTSASSLSFVRRRRSKPRTRRAFCHRSTPRVQRALRHRSTSWFEVAPAIARQHAPCGRFGVVPAIARRRAPRIVLRCRRALALAHQSHSVPVAARRNRLASILARWRPTASPRWNFNLPPTG